MASHALRLAHAPLSTTTLDDCPADYTGDSIGDLGCSELKMMKNLGFELKKTNDHDSRLLCPFRFMLKTPTFNC